MKQTIRIGLVSLLAVAMLLGVIPLVHADSGDNADPDAVVDITIKDDLKLDIAASGPCKVNVRQEGSNTEGMFLSPDGVVYSHASCNDPDAIIDVTISDDLVHIAVSGPCKVNVRVEGPSEVYIDAGDEVELNVEASDESQVFLDDQSLDNPAQKPDEPAQGSVVPVIWGVFPAAGLLAFFLIRRRAKNNINKEVKK